MQAFSSWARFILMQRLSFWAPIVATLVWLGLGSIALANSGTRPCVCPELKCPTCEVLDKVEMVVLKCGPKQSQIRSCSQYRCQRPPDYAQCLAAAGGQPGSGREPVGEVAVAVGAPQLSSLQEPNRPAALGLGDSVANGDRVVTGPSDRVTIRFRDGSQLAISPRSSVTIANFAYEETKGRKAGLIALEQGRVRARVRPQPNSSVASFRIQTKTAVAGVRGTDFLTSYTEDQDRSVTLVQTISGEVALGRLGTEPDLDARVRSIRAGEEGRFVAMLPKTDASSLDAWRRAAEGGQFLPIRPIDESERGGMEMEFGDAFGSSQSKGLTEPVEVASSLQVQEQAPGEKVQVNPTARQPAGAAESSPLPVGPVCKAPAGRFGECKFATKLRSGSAVCVRSQCDASGRWSQETNLPATQRHLCDSNASATRVGECGAGL